jgi:hypothetical protein
MTPYERLSKLIDLHYENIQGSPDAIAYSNGWIAAEYSSDRSTCPYSNEYNLDPNVGGYYVELYIHWNRGYDAWLRWKDTFREENQIRREES